MKKPNTMKHWAALAVAAYYDKNEEACRMRDLWPLVEELFETPQSLSNALVHLSNDDYIGHIRLDHNEPGGVIYAYYPTKLTIEALRDLELPTEQPDGSPLPDGFDLTMPTARVSKAADDSGDVPPPTKEAEAPSFERPPYSQRRNTSKSKHIPEYSDDRMVKFDPAGPAMDRSAADSDDSSDDPVGEVDPDTDFECPYCGRDDFDSYRSLGGHKGGCPENPENTRKHVCECGKTFNSRSAFTGHLSSNPDHKEVDEPVDESDDDPAGEHVCPYCGRGFDSGQGLGGHKGRCPENPENARESYCSCGRVFETNSGLRSHLAHRPDHEEVDEPVDDSAPDEPDDPPVGHDDAYMTERSVPLGPPEWDWADVSNRLYDMSHEAHEAGLHRLSTVYKNFGSLAMERDLNESSGVESEANAILTKEMALLLLGAHHREVAPEVVENDDVAAAMLTRDER